MNYTSTAVANSLLLDGLHYDDMWCDPMRWSYLMPWSYYYAMIILLCLDENIVMMMPYDVYCYYMVLYDDVYAFDCFMSIASSTGHILKDAKSLLVNKVPCT